LQKVIETDNEIIKLLKLDIKDLLQLNKINRPTVWQSSTMIAVYIIIAFAFGTWVVL